MLQSFPIFSDSIVVAECSQEMGSIVLAGILNGKVVNDQGEAYASGVMLPEARGKGAWVVAIG